MQLKAKIISELFTLFSEAKQALSKSKSIVNQTTLNDAKAICTNQSLENPNASILTGFEFWKSNFVEVTGETDLQKLR